MSALDDAKTALTQIQTDDSDVQTQVSNALAAVQAAQASQGGTVDPNDTLVTDIIAAFTTAGYTVTAPVPPAGATGPEAEIPATT